MTWYGKLLGRIVGEQEVTLTAASPYMAPTYDADMDGFRSLAGRGDPHRDLLPLEHDEHLRMADYLATRNPMGRRMVGIFRDMTLGDNVAYDLGEEATDAARDWVGQFWTDNDMAARVTRWAEGISRHGERVVPASKDPAGRVRLGFVHPSDVAGVRYGHHTDSPERVKLKDTATEPGEELDVVRLYREEDDDLPEGVEPGTWAGDAFYWYVNRSEGQRRGMSDLLAFADWLDALDELVFVGMDRAKTSLHVFFDVELQGMDEAGILSWLANATPPKPGTIRAHNELVKWELKAPQLASAEIHQLHRDIKEHILGNAGFPLHWFGTGEGANRASAAEMTMPTLRMLRSRRAYLVDCLKGLLEFVLDCGVRAGGLQRADRESVTVTVSIPELEDSKLGSLSSAVQQVTQAVAIAVESGWIPATVAQRVLQALLSEIGVEYDPEEVAQELERQQQEQREREEAATEAAQERARAMLQGRQNGNSPTPAPPAEGEGQQQRQPGQLDPRETLNGAQVSALKGLVEAVAAGDLPESAALEIMQLAFGLTADEARRIMADVRPTTKKPKPPVPVPGDEE
jgi:hypothetical protein